MADRLSFNRFYGTGSKSYDRAIFDNMEDAIIWDIKLTTNIYLSGHCQSVFLWGLTGLFLEEADEVLGILEA